MIERKGKFSIHRVHSNKEDDFITVEVDDEISGCQAIEVRISLLGFADALMAHGYQDCVFKLNESGVIGKARELREITVPRPSYEKNEKEKTALAWIKKHAPNESD